MRHQDSRGTFEEDRPLIGRKCISWRPIQVGNAIYNYIDRRTGQAVRRSQPYKSWPMLQMMERIVAAEAQWVDHTSVFARPAHLRLRLQMRSCKLKCELADEVSPAEAVTMLASIQQAADKHSKKDASEA